MSMDPRRRFRERAQGVGPAPLGDIVSRGTRLRRRRLTAAASTVALVLVAASVVGYQALQPAPKVKLHVVGPPSTAPVTPSPALSPTAMASPQAGLPVVGVTGLAIEDQSWVSDAEGWLLGTATCTGSPCTVILHTGDGGQTWDRASAPDGGSVAHVRFASLQIGYAYGSSDGATSPLYMTTDGATTWEQQSGAGNVEDLDVSQGTVVAITYHHSGCPLTCDPMLESAAAGSAAWRTLPAPAISQGFGESVLVQGSDIYFLSYGHPAGGTSNAQTRIDRSMDGGAHWVSGGDPCSAPPRGADTGQVEWDAGSPATGPGGFVALICTQRGAQNAFLLQSTDAGSTWTRLGQTPNAGRLTVGSARNFAAFTTTGVVVSHDGGTTWRTTLQGNRLSAASLSFEDATTLRASFGGATIYTSVDAGETWTASQPAG
ncbi:MAG TPA: hypothetical protein VFW71_06505 [Actinomycetota bacterium]|nr:hypothetical protein [Actinomycetota bacterium]